MHHTTAVGVPIRKQTVRYQTIGVEEIAFLLNIRNSPLHRRCTILFAAGRQMSKCCMRYCLVSVRWHLALISRLGRLGVTSPAAAAAESHTDSEEAHLGDFGQKA